MHDLAPIVAMISIFGWIPLKILVSHRERMARISQDKGLENAATLQALDELRTEVRALRETTTRFDMSFDTALTRLEERVDRVETRSYQAQTDDPITRLRTRGE